LIGLPKGEGNIRTEELRKSDRRRTFQTLRAPVDGTVQQLIPKCVDTNPSPLALSLSKGCPFCFYLTEKKGRYYT
jgi:hypothetical protein